MKPTSDNFFVDSNIFLYLFDNNEDKKTIAKTFLTTQSVISTQVISENMNVLFKKYNTQLTSEQIKNHKNNLINHCTVVPITVAIVEKAFEIKEKYLLQWYDSVILATAYLHGCTIIYSEDLQHNQIIEDRLTIINPFI